MREHTVPRIEGLIVRHKSDGRCIYSKPGTTAPVQACLQSGVSVAASALANGLNANLLRKWIRQHEASTGKVGARRKRHQQPAGALLSIQLSELPQAASVPTQVTVKLAARTQGAIEIE